MSSVDKLLGKLWNLLAFCLLGRLQILLCTSKMRKSLTENGYTPTQQSVVIYEHESVSKNFGKKTENFFFVKIKINALRGA